MSLAPLTTKETKAPPAGRATSPFAPKLALSTQRTALDASARTSPASTFRAGGRLQRKPSGSSPASVAPPIVHDTLRTSGQPMDPATQTFFEQRFRHDFSQVRIHNDAQAHASAEAVGARAYTVGPRIVFGPGGPNRRLLGHELTHVVQQQGAAAAPASPLGSSLAVWDDPASEREADRAASQAESGQLAGPVNAGGRAALQRDADPSEGFGWFEDKLLRVALDPLGLSGSLLDMVGASIKGFYVTMRDEGPAHAAQAWDRVKDAFHHPSQLVDMVLNYWWGLIKGIFSPITGLISLAGLVIKLPFLAARILATAWRKREELAADLGRMYARGQQLGATAREVVTNAMHNPLETAKALAGWFSSLGGKATSAAADAGRGAAHLLLGEVSKPLPELGGAMGEFLGTALVNVVLFFFTAGVGDAIVQLGVRIGELGAWLGEAGEVGGMLGNVAAKVETLLFTVGGWITKVEQGLAAATETIFKPLGKLMSGFGDFLGDLRAFFRELFEVSEESLALDGKVAGDAAEKLGTGAAPTAAPKPVIHEPTPPAAPHTTPAATPHAAPSAAKPNLAAQGGKDADIIDLAAAREKRAAADAARKNASRAASPQTNAGTAASTPHAAPAQPGVRQITSARTYRGAGPTQAVASGGRTGGTVGNAALKLEEDVAPATLAHVAPPEPIVNPPVPAPSVAPTPDIAPPVKAPAPEPTPASATAGGKAPAAVGSKGVQAAAAVAAKTKGDDPTQKKRPPFVLRLPGEKAPHLNFYRSWLGVLQSDPNYDRGRLAQRKKWNDALRIGGSDPIRESVYERGHALGLTGRDGEERIRIPDWARTKDRADMQVDHKIEMQLTPLSHRDRVFDSMYNYELLDQKTNGSVGPRLAGNVAAERAKQVAFDPTLADKVLKFDEVQLESGTGGLRWQAEELQEGAQLDAYEGHR